MSDKAENLKKIEAELNGGRKLKPRHPATFSKNILAKLDELIPAGLYLDPCAGVGKIHQLERNDRYFVSIEIEKPWADADERTICGDMFVVVGDWVRLTTVRFDGIVVSWVYGNRMSDSHKASDSSRRHSYTHDIRTFTGDENYTLDPANSGTMYFWQDVYREWHAQAYTLLRKVVNDDGKPSFFNVKNFVRKGEVQRVIAWHMECMKDCGWEITNVHMVGTPGMRFGENSDARADAEAIIEARRGK